MSRIFDALRRSEQTKTGKPASQPPGGGRRQDLLRSQDWESVSFEPVKRVVCNALPEEHVLGVGQNQNPEQEKFRVLCHRLRQMREQKKLRKVLIASAIPKEGKTFVALNLTTTLARSSPRVLLVEADMRQPRINRALGLRPLSGLAEFLEDRIELTAACRRVDPLGFYLLPAGHPSTNPVELLQKPGLQELMARTMAAFDWIVFDSPPLTLFADAHYLATLVDAVLLVVREGSTPREAAKQGVVALQGAFVAGVVLNASTDLPSDHYYNGYSSAPPD